MPTPVRTALGAVPNPILCLLAVDVFLALMHWAGPPVPEWAARGGYREYLWNLNREGNIPTWYASIQLAAIAALMLALASVSERRRRVRAVAVGGGALFLFMSLDEIAGLHEKFGRYLETVGDRSGTALEQTGPWMLIVVPVLLALLVLAAVVGWELLRDRRKLQWLYLTGLAIYVVSFAGGEVLQNFVSDQAYYDVVWAEEAGEMVGATLLLWATYELLRCEGVRLVSSSRNSSHSGPTTSIR